ncbi:hypothetical protein CEXT_810971 [Caerostris extrusa]|uniref:Uncharacterized protein n=1 Tax=Caerostris extrusa TaxID=172846 RepID=A0AAV4PAA4_CAEEX|nr:hypothetical protein CEXT_810971 [Caerostris extrusa]
MLQSHYMALIGNLFGNSAVLLEEKKKWQINSRFSAGSASFQGDKRRDSRHKFLSLIATSRFATTALTASHRRYGIIGGHRREPLTYGTVGSLSIDLTLPHHRLSGPSACTCYGHRMTTEEIGILCNTFCIAVEADFERERERQRMKTIIEILFAVQKYYS